MNLHENEQRQLRSTALQNASSIQAARQRAEERLRAVFSQAAVGIAIADLDGRFQEVNQRFSGILGFTQEELYGRTIIDFTHPDDVDRTQDNFRRLLAGEIQDFVYEKRFVRKDGSPVWALATVTLLRDDSGKPLQYIGVVQDISDRKNAEHLRTVLASCRGTSTDTVAGRLP